MINNNIKYSDRTEFTIGHWIPQVASNSVLKFLTHLLKWRLIGGQVSKHFFFFAHFCRELSKTRRSKRRAWKWPDNQRVSEKKNEEYLIKYSMHLWYDRLNIKYSILRNCGMGKSLIIIMIGYTIYILTELWFVHYYFHTWKRLVQCSIAQLKWQSNWQLFEITFCCVLFDFRLFIASNKSAF